MFALSEIVEINRRAAARACRVEDNHNRACSFSGDARSGVVLHSAKFRNTVFLRPSLASGFLRRWHSVNSQEARKRLVEGFFE